MVSGTKLDLVGNFGQGVVGFINKNIKYFSK